MRIGLISCVKSKADKPCKAKDMYVSPLFKGMYAYAQAHCDAIYILSAKYGLLHPDEHIKPYNDTLKAKTEKEKKYWSYKVLIQLSKKTNIDNDEYIILAGKEYRKYLIRKIKHYHIPMEDLSMGNQLSFLSK